MSKQLEPAETGELRGNLLRLLENAIGVDIDEANFHRPLIVEYDIDLADVFWRIRRELGLVVDVKSIKKEDLPTSIAEIVDCVGAHGAAEKGKGPVRRV